MPDRQFLDSENQETHVQSENSRRALGAEKLKQILGQQPADVERNLGDLAPDLAKYIIETVYGDIYQRPALDAKTRQIVTVAALSTLGTAGPQLRTHISGALRCGVSREELIEVMMQLLPYAGLATAINGVTACREVFVAEDQKGGTSRG
jgi:4-carboxymuconolactone decarboxylase